MAEKIKTSAEILAELGIVKNLPVTEILNNVDQNIVPSVEEKIKDSSTEEYSIEEKKDYTKSKILNNKEVDYIDNIKSDKQRNDIMRLKDVFRDNPQFVTEYLNAIKKYGSVEKAKEAGSGAALLQGDRYLFSLAKDNPSLRADVKRYGLLKLYNNQNINFNPFVEGSTAIMGGDDRYDREIRIDEYGRLRKKAYESELLVKTRKGAEIAIKKGARGTSIVAAALFDALPKGNESNIVSYIESRWPEVKDSREGVEELAEDLTQMGISFILGKKILKLFGKAAGKVAPGYTKRVIDALAKSKTYGQTGTIPNVKNVSNIAQKYGSWSLPGTARTLQKFGEGTLAYGIGEYITRDDSTDKTLTDATGESINLSPFAGSTKVNSEAMQALLNTSMEETKKLTGKKKAAAILRNRLKFAKEGTALIGGLNIALRGLAIPTIKFAGRKIASPILNKVGDVITFAEPVVAGTLTGKYSPLPFVAKKLSKVKTKLGFDILTKAGIPPAKDWKLLSDVGGFTFPKVRDRWLKIIDRSVLTPLRTDRALPGELAIIKQGEKEYIKSQQKLVDMSLRNIERKIYKLAEVGMGSRVIGRGGTLKVEQYWKTVVEALNGDKLVFKNLDKSLSPFVKEIRTQIDDLSKVLSKYVDDEGARKAIKQGLGNYLTTSYEIFKGSFRAKKDVIARAEKWFEELLERTTHNGRSAAVIAADATKMVKTFMTKGGTLVEGTTAAERLKSISSLIPPEGILKGKVKIPQVLQELMGKVTDPRAIILDTVTKQATLIGHMQANKKIVEQGLKLGYIFRAADDQVATTAKRLTGVELVPIETNGLKNSLLKLDDIYKQPNGKSYYTIPEIAEGIVSDALWTDKFLTSSLYKKYLAAKTTSQLSKTVLSVMTQSRNFETAAFFALLNGHVGRQASMIDSMQYTFGEIIGTGKNVDMKLLREKINEYVKYGVTDTSAVAGEVEGIIADFAKGAYSSTDEWFTAIMKNPVFRKATEFYQGADNAWKAYGYEFTRSQFIPAIPAAGFAASNALKLGFRDIGVTIAKNGSVVSSEARKKILQDWYKTGVFGDASTEAGRLQAKNLLKEAMNGKILWQELAAKQWDDVFKLKWDPFKLDGIAKTHEESIKQISAQYVKNTYPNYGMVPAIVKNWRRMPFGNFVAFNSEIIRNVVSASMYTGRELSSSNPWVRKMGARRLMGMATTLYGVDKTIGGVTEALTGIDEKVMNAYRKFYSPWYKKGHKTYPISKIAEDGSFWEFDQTLENPYFQITGAFELASEIFTNPEYSEEKVMARVFEKLFYDINDEKMGAIPLMFSSFIPEPMLLEKILDIMPTNTVLPGARGGKTTEGFLIYNAKFDGVPYAIAKSFAHIFGAINPATIDGVRKTINAFDQQLDSTYSRINTTAQAIKLALGLAAEKNDPKSKMPAVINGLSKKLNSTRENFYKKIYNANDIRNNPLNFVEQFELMQKNRYREMNDVLQFTELNKKLGFSVAEQYEVMVGKQGFSKKSLSYLFSGKYYPAALPNYKEHSALFPRAFKNLKEHNPDLEFEDIYPIDLLRPIILKWGAIPLGMNDEQLDIYFDNYPEIKSLGLDKIEDLKIYFEKKKNDEVMEPVSSLPLPNTKTTASLIKPNVASDTAPVSAETVKMASVNKNVDPQTNLTRIENALLSDNDKAIKLGQRTRTV
jgi:hypothetical protein